MGKTGYKYSLQIKKRLKQAVGLFETEKSQFWISEMFFPQQIWVHEATELIANQ